MFGIDDMFMGAIGGLIGGADSYFSKQEDQDFAGQQREAQQAFQEKMRGSAYQTAVSDMQKAGLNPMLAYSQGGSAMASGSAPVVGGGESAGGGMRASLSTASQLKLQSEQMDLIKAQADKEKAQAELARAQIPQTASNVALQGSSAAQINQMIEFLKSVNPYRERSESAGAQLEEAKIPEAQGRQMEWKSFVDAALYKLISEGGLNDALANHARAGANLHIAQERTERERPGEIRSHIVGQSVSSELDRHRMQDIISSIGLRSAHGDEARSRTALNYVEELLRRLGVSEAEARSNYFKDWKGGKYELYFPDVKLPFIGR